MNKDLLNIYINFSEFFFLGGIIGLIMSLFIKKISKKLFLFVSIISATLFLILSLILSNQSYLAEMLSLVDMLIFSIGVIGLLISLANKKLPQKLFLFVSIISSSLFLIYLLFLVLTMQID